MKVLIFGASGSGTTTLANEVGKIVGFVHLDIDAYYWKKTQPPFQDKIPLNERNKNLKADFNTFENVILSGSLVSWGKEWESSFDLVIFIQLDNNERMKRLEKREAERYGKQLLTDKNLQRTSKAFLEWANQYENPDFKGRSLKVHNDWMKLLDCEILRLNGAIKLNNKTEKVVAAIQKYG